MVAVLKAFSAADSSAAIGVRWPRRTWVTRSPREMLLTGLAFVDVISDAQNAVGRDEREAMPAAMPEQQLLAGRVFAARRPRTHALGRQTHRHTQRPRTLQLCRQGEEA